MADPIPILSSRRHASSWHALAAGMVHSLLLTFIFPPVGLWFLTPFVPLPLALVALRSPRPPRDALIAGVGSLPFWLFQQAWTIDVTNLGFVPLVLYLALFPALFFWAVSRVHRRFPLLPLTLVVPILWTGLEMLRGDVLWGGYAWFQLAHPLIDAEFLARPAAYVGVYGLSFMTAAWTAVALDLARRRRASDLLFPLLGAVVLAGAWWAPTFLPTPASSSRRVAIASVQTNVPQSNKTSSTTTQKLEQMDDLEALTLEAARARPDVILWPETMKPGLSLDARSVHAAGEARLAHVEHAETGKPAVQALDTDFARRTLAVQLRAGAPVLVGEDGFDNLRFEDKDGGLLVRYDRRFNSVFLVAHGEVEEARYDKVHLTPFGETMPYIAAWPWLSKTLTDLAARGMSLDLASGERLTVFEVPSRRGDFTVRLVSPICFESTVTSLCRKMVFQDGQRRADVLLNLTNDGWFGRWDAGRMQHLQIARWRCLELGTPMVRSANTGLSALIDAQGRVVSSLEPHTAGVLIARVDLPGGPTPYARLGNIAGWACLAGLFALLAASLRPAGAAKG